MTLNITKDFKAKQWFIFIIAILLLTDLTIFLNIPVLRQVLGFLCFTIIPGILILHILKLDKIELLEKFVLAVGLSVAFLMFVGLFINEIYYALGYKTPLSTDSLMISFSVIMAGLWYCAYKRDSGKIFTIPKLSFKNNIEKILFLIPLCFPFLSFFGADLMNRMDNNILIMFLFFLILGYVVLLTLLKDKFKDKISEQVYPLAIIMISISLLFIGSLRGDYFISGGDINEEYYTFHLALNHNNHWSIEYLRTSVNACLSIGILSTIYFNLLSIDIPIYKICYPLIFSIIPLIMYLTFKDEYLTKNYAFLSSCFFMFQYVFTQMISNWARVEIAMLFFALSFMILLNNRVDKLKRRILFIIFMIGVIFSHYSTAYVTFIILSLSLLILVLQEKYKKLVRRDITVTFVILFWVVIFFWYGQLTATFNSFLDFTTNTFINLQNLFLEEARAETTLKLFGKTTNLPEKISYSVHLTTFILIGIGVVSLIKKSKLKLNTYLSTIVVCSFILALVEILPFLSLGYDMVRTYQLAIILLSPAFVFGCITVSKFLRQNPTMIILFVLILQFLAGNLLFYQFAGVPHSRVYNSEGLAYTQDYVHCQDIAMAQWVKNSKGDFPMCFDAGGRYTRSIGLMGRKSNCFRNNETTNEEYICLRYRSVVNEKVLPSWSNIANLSEYSHLFIGKSKIYNNGGAEVWR